MKAYDLLAKCRHLTLAGINKDGELEWIGTYQQWINSEEEKQNIIHLYNMRKQFKDIWR
jgi:hypothetical protein